MVVIQLRRFSVCLGNGISYTLGASGEKCIVTGFLNGCSFIGLLTNGVIRIGQKRIDLESPTVFSPRRVGTGQNILSKKRSWVEVGTFTRMRCEMPLEDSFHRQAFRTRGCLPAPARERPVRVCGDGLRPKFAGISLGVQHTLPA